MEFFDYKEWRLRNGDVLYYNIKWFLCCGLFVFKFIFVVVLIVVVIIFNYIKFIGLIIFCGFFVINIGLYKNSNELN